jgi:acyl-CoA thioester hydrolase
MAETFTQRITIAPADIDELGHVNNVVYLRWAQDIAIAHWASRGTPEMLQTYVWVVARHEVDYHAPLVLGDEAEARTWVAPSPRGALWARHIEIGKPGAAKPAAQVLSHWALLDAATRRVKRVPPELVARFV